MQPITETRPPDTERHGGDEPEWTVVVEITELDGTTASARLDLPADAAPSHRAAAILSAARGAALTHSHMLSTLFVDLITAGAMQSEMDGRMTVSSMDSMAAEHERQTGHRPGLLSVPGVGMMTFETVRAVLAATGNL